MRIFAFLILLSVNSSCYAKNSTWDKSVESIDGLYLQDIADRLSENLNRTNNEELGVTYIKVNFSELL